MAKQNKTVTDIISKNITDAIAEAVTPIAPPVTRASELKARVMARISGKKSFDLMTVKAEDGEWITLLPGVEKKVLSESAEGLVQSYLLRMAAGSTIPPHKHDTNEECLMLEGDAMIGDIALSVGDYHFAPKGSKHGLVTTETGVLAFFRAY
ncbi:MAG: cupin domain-containing protein [Methylococcaceae bacterium]